MSRIISVLLAVYLVMFIKGILNQQIIDQHNGCMPNDIA
jgi:hypothetical protein